MLLYLLLLVLTSFMGLAIVNADCEIEQLDIKDRYGILLFLLPIRTDIKALLDATIAECNQFGNFLSGVYTVTNVKELSEEEIIAIIDRNGNVKASH